MPAAPRSARGRSAARPRWRPPAPRSRLPELLDRDDIAQIGLDLRCRLADQEGAAHAAQMRPQAGEASGLGPAAGDPEDVGEGVERPGGSVGVGGLAVVDEADAVHGAPPAPAGAAARRKLSSPSTASAEGRARAPGRRHRPRRRSDGCACRAGSRAGRRSATSRASPSSASSSRPSRTPTPPSGTLAHRDADHARGPARGAPARRRGSARRRRRSPPRRPASGARKSGSWRAM